MTKGRKILLLSLISIVAVIAIIIISIVLSGKPNLNELQYSEGLRYNLLSNGEYEVSGIGTCSDTHIVLPSVYSEKPVTSIADEAFKGCESITSITIAESITTVGQYAFEECSNLSNVTFKKCKLNISPYAFKGCGKLTTIELPNDIQKIGYGVFEGCWRLKYNEFDNAKYLGNAENPYLVLAKSKGEKINSCTIHQNARIIMPSAFSYCSAINDITIPDKVIALGDNAFYSCTNLKSIVIGESVSNIGRRIFENCPNLSTVYYKSTLSNWDKVNIGLSNELFSELNVFYYSENEPSESKSTQWRFVNNVPTLWLSTESVRYSEGFVYTELSDGSYEISGIGSCRDSYISIPPIHYNKPVTKIGDSAFADSTFVKQITVPNSVTSIGDLAFWGCHNLTSITIGEGVQSISENAFRNCEILESILVYNNPKYKSIDGNLYSKDGSALIQYAIGKKDATFTIPNGVTKISSNAFSGCTSLTSVTIGGDVDSVENDAFSDCTNLVNVVIGDKVSSIGTTAFSNCSSLKNILLGEKVEHIGDYAFTACTSLVDISVAENNVHFKSIDGNLYSFDCKKIIIYAPGKTEKTFALPSGVTIIGASSFYGCTDLEYVDLGKTVEYIESSAFAYCSSLKNIIVPDAVIDIGSSVFWECTGLVSIVISNKIASIGTGAFWGCSNLQNVYYCGTEDEWNNIEIYSDNKCLTRASISYNYNTLS